MLHEHAQMKRLSCSIDSKFVTIRKGRKSVAFANDDVPTETSAQLNNSSEFLDELMETNNYTRNICQIPKTKSQPKHDNNDIEQHKLNGFMNLYLLFGVQLVQSTLVQVAMLLQKKNDQVTVNAENAENVAGNVDTNDEQLGAWEAHTKGFASRVMKKYGYKDGKGIGKNEDGIVKPVQADGKKHFNQVSSNADSPAEQIEAHHWPSNTILITGSSMLQGIDEKRMSRRKNVKVRPNPGATIRDMHDHLNALLRKKTDYLILHAGGNDASNKETTSDDIFDGLMELKAFAES